MRIYFLVVLGAILTITGFEAHRMASYSKAQPHRITCADLGTAGPGDNAHVIMTRFILCEQYFVIKENPKSRIWSHAWVPAVPIDGEYARRLRIQARIAANGRDPGKIPLPRDVRVIVKSTSVFDQAGIERLCEVDSLQGLVVNKIEQLGREETKILREGYPGIEFKNCVILHERREPPGTAESWGLLIGGLGLLGLGMGLAVVRRWGRRDAAAVDSNGNSVP